MAYIYKNYVLIIGNGFDLDLGLKTSYKDFVESNYWPWKTRSMLIQSDLARYLCKKVQEARWFDFEQWLMEYASAEKNKSFPHIENSGQFVKQDINSFELLLNKLSEYIESCCESPVPENSKAFRLIDEVAKNGFGKIYSFNYTDLNDLYHKRNQYRKKIIYSHVHGSIKNNDIILGIEPATEVVEGYRFVRKVYQKGYRSQNILYDMLGASEVIIFGHSLGVNDYHHFREFFKQQSAENLPKEKSKRITFITYDDKSRMDLLDQLRDMNDKQIDRLFSRNIIEFIHTIEEKSSEFDELLKRISMTDDNLDDSYLY